MAEVVEKRNLIKLSVFQNQRDIFNRKYHKVTCNAECYFRQHRMHVGVPKDVPPLAIVVGNPARIVGYRDEKEYYALKKHGAVRAVSARCTRLWIPAEMREKYHELLNEVGYNIDNGREYLEFTGRD